MTHRDTPRRIGAVLFDAAGTLVELRESPGETYARFAADHGVRLPPWRLDDAFARILGRAPAMVFTDCPAGTVARRERDWWRDVVRGTFRAADGTARFDDFEAFFDALWRHYTGTGAWRAREDVRAALTALGDAGHRLAVLSNFDSRLPSILEQLDLARHFEAVLLPGALGAAKPDPACFRAALERLALDPARSVVVGDDEERDLAPARALGLHAIHVGSLATLAELPDRVSEALSRRPGAAGTRGPRGGA